MRLCRSDDSALLEESQGRQAALQVKPMELCPWNRARTLTGRARVTMKIGDSEQVSVSASSATRAECEDAAATLRRRALARRRRP
mmetsp:Transcript_11662/g.41657  ORF Transcript_11662/g.41657 Transcript_11662/m.41657 type:complete len:85 (-) Transcript_11662:487-741(-)